MSSRISLGQRAQQYLAERRRLGFDLSDMQEALESFTEYADRLKRHGPITLEVMSEWARCDHIQSTDPRTWARRLKRKGSSKHVTTAESCRTAAVAGKNSINRVLARSGVCYARGRGVKFHGSSASRCSTVEALGSSV